MVSEYDQEISQSHTVDQPTASLRRATGHLQQQDIGKTMKAKQPALSLSPFKLIAKLERSKRNVYKNKDKHRTPQTMGF